VSQNRRERRGGSEEERKKEERKKEERKRDWGGCCHLRSHRRLTRSGLHHTQLSLHLSPTSLAQGFAPMAAVLNSKCLFSFLLICFSANIFRCSSCRHLKQSPPRDRLHITRNILALVTLVQPQPEPGGVFGLRLDVKLVTSRKTNKKPKKLTAATFVYRSAHTTLSTLSTPRGMAFIPFSQSHAAM
jgi:hypothetical protein